MANKLGATTKNLPGDASTKARASKPKMLNVHLSGRHRSAIMGHVARPVVPKSPHLPRSRAKCSLSTNPAGSKRGR